MKLFLGGGGDRQGSFELDKKFVASLDLSKPILYIPIAINTQKYPYSACIAWLSGVLSPLGVTNIVMWTEKDLKQKTENDFEQFGGIYIGGGNTFKLLKELKEFETLEIIGKLAKRGIPIYGGSAGAIILARTIIPALSADKNDVGLSDFLALNLVRDWDIWCHYAESNDKTILEYMNKFDLKKIIAIPETAGLYVTESAIEAVGPSSIKVFENNLTRVVKSGERV